MRTAVVQQIRTVKEIKEQSKKSRPDIEQKKKLCMEAFTLRRSQY